MKDLTGKVIECYFEGCTADSREDSVFCCEEHNTFALKVEYKGRKYHGISDIQDRCKKKAEEIRQERKNGTFYMPFAPVLSKYELFNQIKI